MIRDRASAPARDGPYGTKPRRFIVLWFIEMLTTRPPPAAEHARHHRPGHEEVAREVGGDDVAEAVRLTS